MDAFGILAQRARRNRERGAVNSGVGGSPGQVQKKDGTPGHPHVPWMARVFVEQKYGFRRYKGLFWPCSVFVTRFTFSLTFIESYYDTTIRGSLPNLLIGARAGMACPRRLDGHKQMKRPYSSPKLTKYNSLSEAPEKIRHPRT